VDVVVVAFTAAVITVVDSTVEDIDAEDTDVAVVVVVIVVIAVMVVVVLVTEPLESLLYKKKPLRLLIRRGSLFNLSTIIKTMTCS
jgi:uncharacterized membrane protein